MTRKWDKIHELCDYLAEDSTLMHTNDCIKHLKCICYAPNIGYRSWIFKYKGILIALFDAGNGHYEFHTAVTYLDVICARIDNLFKRWVL